MKKQHQFVARWAAIILACTCCLFSITLAFGQTSTITDNATSLLPEDETEEATNLYSSVHELLDANYLWPDKILHLSMLDEPKFGSLKEAVKTIKTELSTLGDPYTRYLSKDEASQIQKQFAQPNIVEGRMLSKDIGYIKIKIFGECAEGETEKTLRKLASARGFVVDLRRNPGGLMGPGFKIFAMFIDQGKYGFVEGRNDWSQCDEELVVTGDALQAIDNGDINIIPRKPNLIGNRPVVILMDQRTGSVAEMLINALVGNGIASTVGAKTFGKGVGLTTFDNLPGDGALIVTTNKMFSPSHVCINGIGIMPQKAVTNTAGHDEQLAAAILELDEKLGLQDVSH